MPDISPPSTIFSDSTPGESLGTNEAMPRFGGRAEPGQTVHLSVDGESMTIVPTPSGFWEASVGELADGEHEYELWAEDASGNRSDSIEWTNDVQADPNDRRAQRARNDRWNQGEAQKWIQDNEQAAGGPPLTPPRPVTGGGQPEPMPGDGAPGSGSGGSASGAGGGTSADPGTGTGIGSGSGAGASPAGLEKGNAQTFGRIG